MRKNKLMISAITLAFAVVAVVSTTFAWFTMNTTNTVDNLEFNAASSSGLYMSLDGSNWKTSLTKEDFAAYAATTPSNLKGYGSPLNPVTLNQDGSSFMDHLGESASTGYVEFVINFKCDVETAVKVSELLVTSDADKSIGLVYNNSSSNQTDTDVFWKDYHSKQSGYQESSEATETVTLETSLANAVRVKLSADKTQYVDPSYDGNAYDGFGGIETDLGKSISHQYLSHVSPTDADDIENKNAITKVFNTYKKLNAENETLLTLQEKTVGSSKIYTGSITVTLWVEGFDQDCFDVLFNSSLDLSLTFTTTEVTPVQQQ